MAVELASGYISLSVKLDGATKGLGNLFDKAQKQALDAGKRTGEAYTKGLEAEFEKASAQTSKFAESQKKALDKEADAAYKARAALERLNEARAKGVTGSRLTQLTGQSEAATRRHADAVSELTRETDALTQAQKRQERAQSALNSNLNQQKPSGFLSRWRKSGEDSGQAFNDAASRALGNGSVSRAASDAGGRVKAGFLRSIGSAAALAAPFVGVGSILTAGFSRLESIDAAKAKLTALGNSAATVDTIMNSALESVKGTSYGLGDAATIAASATAAGIKPGQELTKYLGLTADAAAIAGTSLSDMGRIFNQVQTGQRAYTDDLNQLADRGIPIYQWVADEAGVAAEDVKKMAEKGKISSEIFFKAIQKNVAGAAKTIGETSFSGAIENLKAGIGRLGANILGPVFEKIPGIVRDLTPTFDKLGASIKPLVESIVNGFGPAIQRIVDLFQQWKAFLIPFVGTLVAYKVAMLGIVAAQKALQFAFVAYKTIVTAVTVLTKGWTVATLGLNAAMRANVIGLIVTAIAALIAGIVLLYQKNETFRNIVQAAWTGIKTAIGAVVSWITDTVWPALKTAWDAIATGATWLWQNALSPAWNGIKAVIGFAWEIISDIFHNWQVAMNLVGTVATALWQTYISPAWEGIKAAFSAAWDFISPIFDNVKNAFSSTGNFIKNVWNGIAGVIKSAFDGIVNAIKPGLHILGSMLAAIPSNLGPFEIPGADTARSWGEKLQAFRGGGQVRGPGTGTSDSVLAWLSNGEGVVTAKAMNNGGGLLVAALNAGWVPSADYLRGIMIPGYAEGLNPGADWLRSKIMQLWPQITSIGGRRAEDGLGEHSSGNAIDVMIPGWDTNQGVALGNSVLGFLQENASALGLDGVIWRQTSYGYGHGLTTPKRMETRAGGDPTQNHMDHLHVILGKGRGASASPVQVPVSALGLPAGPRGESTVPLVQNPDGTWTSTDPAWAALIKRESGGNPTIRQGTVDANSGGNEAEGLFQITPDTWAANGGTQFAASPSAASPQNQAIVAARIFKKNPSGSDWGAGLPGREDASALSAGLTTTGARKGGATAKQLREADDRITDLENRLDIAQQELDQVNADPKAKDITKQRKQDQVDKLKRDLDQAKQDKADLEAKGSFDLSDTSGASSSSGGKNSGSDPFSKILDGFSELANTAVGGIKESFLPEGFSDPTQWGLMQMGGGLLNFFSGLTPDPVARGILGAFGSGLTGDAGGAVKAIGGIFQPQQNLNADAQGGALAPGAGLMPPGADQHVGTGSQPGPQLPGVTVNANAADANQVGNIVNNQYQPAVRRQFATARNGK